MVKIGSIALPGALALAPMAGVTDAAFREVCREHGAAVTYTEMVSAKALIYRDLKTRSLLLLAPKESPCGAQIFGSDPEIFTEAAGLAAEISGADFIDINMGCPVGKIAGSGDGSALMRDPDRAFRIIEAAIAGCHIPVTVKFRKGWDNGSINAVAFAQMCEEAGAAAVAVHGRTKKQMYSGVADWDIIREVKKSVAIPVFANGDVFSGKDAKRILAYTGADMAMIGRGSFGNPWIFTEGNGYIAGRDAPVPPTVETRVQTAIRQIEAAARYKGEKIACLEARRHFSWYLRGIPHSGYFKKQIVAITSLDEMRKIGTYIIQELGHAGNPRNFDRVQYTDL